jgi:hypothetical protein
MIDLLLKVLKSLKDVGQKESFLKFMGLLASGTFPLHNICYLLFLNIVEWFSCDSTTHMRYGHETVKFWQIEIHKRTTAAVFVIRFSDVKPIWYGTVHLRF